MVDAVFRLQSAEFAEESPCLIVHRNRLWAHLQGGEVSGGLAGG